ncbi:MAG: flagellar assembly protein FliW, partial [Deltaproteobacteria bacterium]
MKIETSRFGSLDFLEDKIIHVPSGLFGFPESKRYTLLDHKKGSPFVWLQ